MIDEMLAPIAQRIDEAYAKADAALIDPAKTDAERKSAVRELLDAGQDLIDLAAGRH